MYDCKSIDGGVSFAEAACTDQWLWFVWWQRREAAREAIGTGGRGRTEKEGDSRFARNFLEPEADILRPHHRLRKLIHPSQKHSSCVARWTVEVDPTFPVYLSLTHPIQWPRTTQPSPAPSPASVSPSVSPLATPTAPSPSPSTTRPRLLPTRTEVRFDRRPGRAYACAWPGMLGEFLLTSSCVLQTDRSPRSCPTLTATSTTEPRPRPSLSATLTTPSHTSVTSSARSRISR